MKTTNKTHLLFIEPINKPSLEPVEDIYTQAVDSIFSKLTQSEDGWRGIHSTGFGKCSDNKHYYHTFLPICANSLSTYYIRHHRQDITQAQLDWCLELEDLLSKDFSSYYNVPFVEGKIYYFEMDENEYWKRDYSHNVYKSLVMVKPISSKGLANLLFGCFYKEISSEYFEENKKTLKCFEGDVDECVNVIVYR